MIVFGLGKVVLFEVVCEYGLILVVVCSLNMLYWCVWLLMDELNCLLKLLVMVFEYGG